MNKHIEKLNASALRLLLMQETRKFVTALEEDSSATDLEIIRDHIRRIVGLLKQKESSSGISS